MPLLNTHALRPWLQRSTPSSRSLLPTGAQRRSGRQPRLLLLLLRRRRRRRRRRPRPPGQLLLQKQAGWLLKKQR
jgi:hypothetical protein